MKHSRTSLHRQALGALLAFGALNAFGGGFFGLAGARGVPTTWLRGSPFHDYFVPSLVLFAVVGGSLFAAAIAVFAHRPTARKLALAAGAILLGWIVAQVAIMGFVSWLQPVTALGAIAILSLARSLRAPPRRPEN